MFMVKSFKIEKIQLIFPKHDYGHLAYEREIQQQPPLGILALASYVQKIIPNIHVELFDGKLLSENDIIKNIDSNIVGFSTWFSNYKSTLSLIRKIKSQKPFVKIIVGGPHTAFLGERIINNNSLIDYVIPGEAELKFIQLLKGTLPSQIPNIYFRHNGNIYKSDTSNEKPININLTAEPNLDLLYPKYEWESDKNSHAMSAFPISGIRGCTRKIRCEYCSIPFVGYRTMEPNNYWRQIDFLNKKYGIDFFFETGDVFIPSMLKRLAAIENHPDIAIRIYSYPGSLKKEHLPYLKNVGVNVIFMGVESYLIWKGKYKRKYGKNFYIESLIDEIKMLGNANINVIPSFILGMPDEDSKSLQKNIDLILKLSQLQNVKEITVSIILPLPGSFYFTQCISDSEIVENYRKIKNKDIRQTDDIDIYILSQLFVDKYTKIGYKKLFEIYNELIPELGQGLANWGYMEPIMYKYF